MDHFKANPNCAGSEEEDNGDALGRFTDGCVGARRLPGQLIKWANKYNNDACDGDESEPTGKFAKRMQKKLTRFSNNMNRKLTCEL